MSLAALELYAQSAHRDSEEETDDCACRNARDNHEDLTIEGSERHGSSAHATARTYQNSVGLAARVGHAHDKLVAVGEESEDVVVLRTIAVGARHTANLAQCVG